MTEARDAVRMIIDTDTAADDSFALLVGLLHPRAQLEAITIVSGNVDFDQQVRNALITIDQAGRTGEVPVYRGARVPMMRPWYAAQAHGDGKGNHSWPAPAQTTEPEGAAAAIARIVSEDPGQIDLLAIGPLTNVATALLLDRDLPRKVRRLWIMGGCDNAVGNVTAAAEYNFYVDPEAAALVLAAGFDVTLVTWTLTLAQATWTSDRLDQLAAVPTSLARFFTILDIPNREHNARVGILGSTHPDSLTAMLMVEPDLIVRQSTCYVAVETGSVLTRGYSLLDRRADRHAHNVRVIDEVDASGFFASFAQLLDTGARTRG